MNVELHLGDCVEHMKTIQKNVIVIADPPYGINADKGTDGFGIHSVKNYQGSWDNSTPNKFVFDKILSIGKKVFIFGGNYFTDKLPVSNHWIVWDKIGEMKFKNPFSDCELIWTNVNKKTVNKYIVIQQGFIAKEKERFHPTQKPVQLLRNIILDYTNKDDVIFDPYMGSGTTGIAAIQLGRSFIGCEIDPKYFAIAQKRIKQAQMQPSLFQLDDKKDKSSKADNMELF